MDAGFCGDIPPAGGHPFLMSVVGLWRLSPNGAKFVQLGVESHIQGKNLFTRGVSGG